MAKLQIIDCITKSGEALPKELRRALVRSVVLRIRQGEDPISAQKAAVASHLALVRQDLDSLRIAMNPSAGAKNKAPASDLQQGGPPAVPPSETGPALVKADTKHPIIKPVMGITTRFTKSGKEVASGVEGDLTRLYSGTADIFAKTPGYEFVGQKIRDAEDDTRMLSAKLAFPFRQLSKNWTTQQMKTAGDDFTMYWQANDEVGQAGAMQMFQHLSPEGQELVNAWKHTAVSTGTINQQIGLKVMEASGRWRPIGFLGDKFFPRKINNKWLKILSAPDKYQAEYQELIRQSLAKGYIKAPSEFDEYSERAVRGFTNGTDKVSMVEHARSSPLPTMVYDYSFDTAQRYMYEWAKVAARTKNFGQPEGATHSPLFEKAQRMTNDDETKKYIKHVEDRIYEKNNPMAVKWGVLRTMASGMMLGNVRSTMRNLISGVGFNMAHNGIFRGARDLLSVRESFQAIDDAYEKGILQDDLASIMQDMEQYELAEKATSLALQTSGWNAVESWTRTMNMLSARAYLRDSIAQNQKNPTSNKSLNARGFFKRLGIDDQQALLDEDGTGPLTDRYLRTAVAEVQGGYGIAQTPALLNTQAGKAIFQFQKWSTQALRHFDRNVVNPALQKIGTGRKEFVEVNGVTYRVPGDMLPLARYMLLIVALGLAQREAEEWIFGIPDREASFAEILSRMQAGDEKALGVLAHKLFMAGISVGGMGLLGNYLQLGMDVMQRQRFKDPLAPPSIAFIVGVGELIQSTIEQGKLTGRDVNDFLTAQVSMYRVGGQAAARLQDVFGTDFRALKLISRKQDLQWLRSVTKRYDDVVGVRQNTTVSGRTGKSPLLPFYASVKEGLLLGDTKGVRNLMREHFQGMPPEKAKIGMESLMQSVRQSQPVRVGNGTGEAMRVNFLRWVKKHLPSDQVARVIEIDKTYRDTAVGLKLLNPREVDIEDANEALRQIKIRGQLQRGE